ncbi:hypothetical protein SARC_09226 [Sphaeroforma arctica JP610]|uniref:Uncharacterized protein n=1 Tax=Sphaeroforma arctica JP610 TaxID=667725 RepID=A0A0L0FNG6_9EUKA|nr:hypothetical protein SARC_09226 [Sphaeroforma arctica JP610]KNC78342.1 hypothetical protein SARC_09226 [Sphaeroforma arctica JP610]|eukprot:XP_014152244.1 hypothetical protein SARC_09226 [Sphaeroforma arctica JP610]
MGRLYKNKMLGPAEWWQQYGSIGAPTIYQYCMKYFCPVNVTVQERHWKLYKDCCSKKSSRLGELSKAQYDMVHEDGYSGPVQTKACLLTEVRANLHLTDNYTWQKADDGSWIDTTRFKISNKDYGKFTRSYIRNYNLSEEDDESDTTASKAPALIQQARNVNQYIEIFETFAFLKSNVANRASLTKKYKDLVVETGGKLYVIDCAVWVKMKSYQVRISPISPEDNSVDRSDPIKHLRMLIDSALWVSIKRATWNGYNKSIAFISKNLTANTVRLELNIIVETDVPAIQPAAAIPAIATVEAAPVAVTAIEASAAVEAHPDIEGAAPIAVPAIVPELSAHAPITCAAPAPIDTHTLPASPMTRARPPLLRKRAPSAPTTDYAELMKRPRVDVHQSEMMDPGPGPKLSELPTTVATSTHPAPACSTDLYPMSMGPTPQYITSTTLTTNQYGPVADYSRNYNTFNPQ